MDAQGTWSFQPVILTLNSLYTFALNLSVFLVISHTGAMTIRVAGVVKDWVVTISPSVCRYNADNDKSVWSWYCMSFIPIDLAKKYGVAAYNNHKLKKEASRGSSDESQHAESTTLTSSSITESSQCSSSLCKRLVIHIERSSREEEEKFLSESKSSKLDLRG
ncbi:hypothetical protein HYC85_012011 [Camellia sinensis]|uniref:Uncharacterized protein n=1 Tax=Camellia sinensis TaxID=4442 RepID=A0A7J7HDQ2_CAMSI|nr:hypothetical protein HYC85_012011 [Camellia sinensis]